MKTVLHTADSRGHANFGWLNSYHSFSFGQYYNPERMHFGALRVLNDDAIAGGTGFGKHPHDNMEIISIPTKGALKHQDSTGTKAVIKENDVQIMSAGTGIQHSEYNDLADENTEFFQIWIVPQKRNISPRYDQKTFTADQKANQILTVVAPDNEQAVWINQQAWISLAAADAGTTLNYHIKRPENGVYVLVIEGSITIEGQQLNKRDALGIWDAQAFNMVADSSAQIMLIDVPMKLS